MHWFIHYETLNYCPQSIFSNVQVQSLNFEKSQSDETGSAISPNAPISEIFIELWEKLFFNLNLILI